MIAKIPQGLKAPNVHDNDIERLHEPTQEFGDTTDESWNRT